VRSPNEDLFRFIGSSFRSVWALELLLVLHQDQRAWSRAELVSTLRASDLVVAKSLESLVAAGLITLEGDSARYMPASDDIAQNVKKLQNVYAARPDAVRRAIVSAGASGATAFADAFKLRKD
jgi:DNA-binding IclR family transcriptional regulator